MTPKRIIYERFLLEEISVKTSPMIGQLVNGLATIGVGVDAYNNGTTLNQDEWVSKAKANNLWKVEGGTSSYMKVTEPVDLHSFPFWTRMNVEEVRRKFAFDSISANFVTDADMDVWFPVAAQEATQQTITSL